MVTPGLRLVLLASTAIVLGTTACIDTTSDNINGTDLLEIYSWWTHPGEAQALDALLSDYTSKYPRTKVIKAANSDVSTARAQLGVRMLGGRPPDTFQASAGGDLLQWVLYNGYDDSDSKLEPLDSLAAADGLVGVLPAPVLRAASNNGRLYGIPVGVVRFNVLYYNKNILDRYGLTPPASLDAFYQVGDALKAQGVVPLALGTKVGDESTIVIFDDILVAKAGATFRDSYLSGHEDPRDPRMVDALNEFVKMLDYANDDHDLHTWDEAVQMVIDGRAAMTMIGDWARGIFLAEGQIPNVNFGETVAPGTTGTFVYAVDTFCLPNGASDREAAVRFLNVVGSAEAQTIFSPIKGSTPPRTDIDLSKLDPLGQKTAASFRQDTLILSETAKETADFNAELFAVLKQLALDRKVTTVINMLRNRYDLL